jgi:ArsR family transcriptional regulator, arsenate/arsenite/antimonite-responsive transcriptional repressor
MRVYASRADELAQLYKALGDETRVRIVHLLARRGELCVCDVETILSVSQSKASRHLNYLKQAGVVADRRDGTWVYYRLAREARPSLRAAIRELRKELAADPVALADLDGAERCARGADCAPLELVRSRGSSR